jgi:hypothetical protein
VFVGVGVGTPGVGKMALGPNSEVLPANGTMPPARLKSPGARAPPRI